MKTAFLVPAHRGVLEPGASRRDEVRDLFLEHFEAGANFDRFVDVLTTLHESHRR